MKSRVAPKVWNRWRGLEGGDSSCGSCTTPLPPAPLSHNEAFSRDETPSPLPSSARKPATRTWSPFVSPLSPALDLQLACTWAAVTNEFLEPGNCHSYSWPQAL